MPPTEERAAKTDTATDWQAIDAAFDRALDLEGDGRRRYLDSLGDDLRRQVEDLLASAEADGPLSGDVGDIAGRLLEATEVSLDPDLGGRRIGSWRIVRRLGAGGMGVVYLAQRADEAFEQTVALKVIRWELADSALVQRFLAERQILAQLNHPNIASLYDGGMTDDGLPYLVLEHVDGVPVDVHCDRRGLSVAQRVRLMAQVCRAVDFAHRNLVVHRDLKPSNILVRDDGVPKLLDFGVAKLLDDAAGHTTRFAPMTPRYAAPEQRRGEPVTVAADVWALGRMTSDLLEDKADLTKTGTADAGTAGSIAEGVDRDLRNILRQAMHPEPERRYRTAGDLAEDLERHLDGLPVRATPPTAGYRLRKWAGRHRATAAAIVAACLAVVLGVAGVVWQAQVAREERDQARQEARRAEEVTSFLQTMFQSATPRLGDELTARDLLDEGAERIRAEVQGAPLVRAELLFTLADSYKWLGELERAEELIREALAIYEREAPDTYDHATTIALLGGVLLFQEQPQPAEELFRQALERFETIDTSESTELEAAVAEARVARLNSLGMALQAQGDPAAAVPLLRQAVELSEQRGYEPGIAMSRGNLGDTLDEMGRSREAEAQHRAAAEIYRRTQPDNTTLATVLTNLSQNLGKQGRLDEALATIDEALALRRQIAGDRSQRAGAEANLAYLLLLEGRADEAAELSARALAVFEEVKPNDTDAIATRANLGWALALAGRTDEALPLLRRVVDDLTERFGRDHRITARGHLRYGAALLRAGRPGDAAEPLERAFGIVREDPDSAVATTTRADISLAVARLRCDVGRTEAGLEPAETARRIYEDLHGPDHWLTAQAEVARARCLDALGRGWDEAAVSSARDVLAATRGASSWEVRRAEELLSNHR